MNTAAIIQKIDAEVERLRKIVALLEMNSVPAGHGQPAGPRKKRTMSPETREKIAAAQRRAWKRGRMTRRKA